MDLKEIERWKVTKNLSEGVPKSTAQTEHWLRTKNLK